MVPESIKFATKGTIVLAQIDKAMPDVVRFGMVLANAGYGSSSAFRDGLTQRRLLWAVAVQPTQKVYTADLERRTPVSSRVRWTVKYPRMSTPSESRVQMIEALGE